MTNQDPILERLRSICLALPEAVETVTWGEPHFRVRKKIFCGYGEDKGWLALTVKLEPDHGDILIQNEARFRRAPYVGRYGWVSLNLEEISSWDEVEELILESYGLIAPKSLLALARQIRSKES